MSILLYAVDESDGRRRKKHRFINNTRGNYDVIIFFENATLTKYIFFSVIKWKTVAMKSENDIQTIYNPRSNNRTQNVANKSRGMPPHRNVSKDGSCHSEEMG